MFVAQQSCHFQLPPRKKDRDIFSPSKKNQASILDSSTEEQKLFISPKFKPTSYCQSGHSFHNSIFVPRGDKKETLPPPSDMRVPSGVTITPHTDEPPASAQAIEQGPSSSYQRSSPHDATQERRALHYQLEEQDDEENNLPAVDIPARELEERIQLNKKNSEFLTAVFFLIEPTAVISYSTALGLAHLRGMDTTSNSFRLMNVALFSAFFCPALVGTQFCFFNTIDGPFMKAKNEEDALGNQFIHHPRREKLKKVAFIFMDNIENFLELFLPSFFAFSINESLEQRFIDMSDAYSKKSAFETLRLMPFKLLGVPALAGSLYVLSYSLVKVISYRSGERTHARRREMYKKIVERGVGELLDRLRVAFTFSLSNTLGKMLSDWVVKSLITNASSLKDQPEEIKYYLHPFFNIVITVPVIYYIGKKAYNCLRDFYSKSYKFITNRIGYYFFSPPPELDTDIP